ncbi:MAG: FAD-dependent oxidoreductase [Planctomycetota bacterium]
MRTRVVVIGGGIAGLWTLRELVVRGVDAVLIERAALGGAQTGWSQGILHSGLKYALDGRASRSSTAIGDVVDRWRACLQGTAEPDLSAATVLSQEHYLWRTGALSSWAGLMGASLVMRAKPRRVANAEAPQPLRDAAGLAAVPELVVSPTSVVAALAEPVLDRAIHGEVTDLVRTHAGVRIGARDTASRDIELEGDVVVFSAGSGNAALRRAAGLDDDTQQIRPLRMVLVRGQALPMVYGHCVDGARTRVTITSERDSAGHVVWQVGGEVAERGAALTEAETLALAFDELGACLPAVDLSGAAWSTYEAPRAEGRTRDGRRPPSEVVHVDDRAVTIWPTKLVLAPRAASAAVEAILSILGDAAVPGVAPAPLMGLEPPPISPAPWEHPDVRWRATSALARGVTGPARAE